MDTLAAGWTAHKAPTGHTYYYNTNTKKSTYQKPLETKSIVPDISDRPETVRDLKLDSVSDTRSSQLESSQPDEVYSSTTRRIQGNVQGGQQESADYPRHKYSIPNADPWVQVRTKLGRSFYHNTSTQESVWTVPDNISQAVKDWESSLSHQEPPQRLARSETLISGEENSDHADQLEQADVSSNEPENDATLDDLEFEEEDIAWQLAAMEEAGEGPIDFGVDDGPELTLEEKADIFKKMLADLDIDIYRPWDLQVESIAVDPRYLILDNTHQRKDAFEQYCSARAKHLQGLRATTKQQDPKVAFLRLLKDHAKEGQYFQEFKRRHKKHEAYKRFGNSDHEREKVYRTFQELLKLSLGERERIFTDMLKAQSTNLEADVRYYAIHEPHAEALISAHRQIG